MSTCLSAGTASDVVVFSWRGDIYGEIRTSYLSVIEKGGWLDEWFDGGMLST